MAFLENLITDYGLFGIFIAALLSYSIFPIPPIEALIVVAVNYLNPFVIFFVTILGATCGSIFNYYIGLRGVRSLLVKYKKTEARARKIFDRFGGMSIVLFGWMPVIGNPLVIVAGTLRMEFWKFLMYSTIGKAWFYILVVWFGTVLTNFL